jgi:hypothetical protein
MQMNLFCAQACYRSVIAANGIADGDKGFCDAACGTETAYSTDPGNPAIYWPDPVSGEVSGSRYRNTFGFLEESMPSNPIVPPPTAASPVTSFHDSSSPSSAARIASSPRNHFRGLFRTANPHWAGGYVMEMIMGPFDSICSGNSVYFQNGNTDFSHVDTIDVDAGMVIAKASSIDGPPERLFCAHSHLKDAPFGYVTSGSTFAINGGQAF